MVNDDDFARGHVEHARESTQEPFLISMEREGKQARAQGKVG